MCKKTLVPRCLSFFWGLWLVVKVSFLFFPCAGNTTTPLLHFPFHIKYCRTLLILLVLCLLESGLGRILNSNLIVLGGGPNSIASFVFAYGRNFFVVGVDKQGYNTALSPSLELYGSVDGTLYKNITLPVTCPSQGQCQTETVFINIQGDIVTLHTYVGSPSTNGFFFLSINLNSMEIVNQQPYPGFTPIQYFGMLDSTTMLFSVQKQASSMYYSTLSLTTLNTTTPQPLPYNYIMGQSSIQTPSTLYVCVGIPNGNGEEYVAISLPSMVIKPTGYNCSDLVQYDTSQQHAVWGVDRNQNMTLNFYVVTEASIKLSPYSLNVDAGYMMTSMAVLDGITFFTSQYQEANGLFYVYQVATNNETQVLDRLLVPQSYLVQHPTSSLSPNFNATSAIISDGTLANYAVVCRGPTSDSAPALLILETDNN